jgi:SNF2 family DNA or RNA helicase
MAEHGLLDARVEKGRIVLSGTGCDTDDFSRLAMSLSWARLHKTDDGDEWHVDITPVTCKRLHDFGFSFEADPESPLHKHLTRWNYAEREMLRMDQPERRVFDGWDHQVRSYHFVKERPAGGLFVAMGGGKTKIALDSAVNRDARKILILSPLSVCGVWRGEIAKHVPPEVSRRVVILDQHHKSVAAKASYLGNVLRAMNGQTLFVVTNYDSAKVTPLADMLLSVTWDECILDEAHRIKDGQTVIGKFCVKLGRKCRHKLALTGTPMPNGPLDLHGQMSFLDQGLFGSSFTSFKQRYSTPHPYIKGKVVDFINRDELIERLAMIAIRIEADVLDLPEPVHQRIPVALTPDVRAQYEIFKRQAIVEIEEGLVTAANAPVKLLRLQQVTSGHWKTEDDQIVPTKHNPKADVLEDLLKGIGADEPVVVFCRFRYDLIALEQIAARAERKYAEVSGRRKELNLDGTLPDDVRLMGVQIQSGGLGVNLTRSAVCVFYSLGYSLADYQQALARLVRPGQLRNVRFIHLVAEDTVDEQVYESLERKANVVEAVMAALRTEQNERLSENQAVQGALRAAGQLEGAARSD